MKKKNLIIIISALAVIIAAVVAIIIINRPAFAERDTVKNVFSIDDNSVNSILGMEYTNLDLSEIKSVTINENVSTLYNFKVMRFFDWESTTLEDRMNIVSKLGKAIYDDDLSPAGDDDLLELEGTYYYSTDKYDVSVSPYSINLSVLGFPMVENEGFNAEFYRINEGDSTDGVVIKANDYKLTDAIAYADSIVETQLEALDWADKLQLRTAIKYTLNDGSEQYVLRYEYVYDEVVVDEAGSYSKLDGTFIPAYVEIRTSEPNVIGYLNINEYKIVKEEDNEDNEDREEINEKILTLSGMLNCTADALAPYGTYKIDNIEFKYCCLYNYPDGTTLANEVIDYRPMWVLRVHTGFTTSDKDPANVDPRMNIYVDAVSGDVYILDCTSLNAPSYFTLE